ncbi:SRPBCC family protein [Caulobacter sp. DWP3-1-3b2]|uniref:SRPBCC family protein n=1 Tax=Caulobacter sp. DWP3-1-3b2 TaxID=2804643 RepID=UPI003CE9BCAD
MPRLGFVVAVMMLACPELAMAANAANADWVRQVERGDIALDAHPDAGGRGGSVRAMIDIDAPPDAVWRTILDCQRAARMTPSVRRCTVLSRDPSGRTETREHVIKWSFLLPAFHSVSRLELDPPRKIVFRCVDGDIKDCEGAWLLESRNGGKATRVTYQNRARAPYGMPSGLAAMAMRRDVPAALRALRRESVAAAR